MLLFYLNLLNSLRKGDELLGKPRILSLYLNSFNKVNTTWALMLDPLYNATLLTTLAYICIMIPVESKHSLKGPETWNWADYSRRLDYSSFELTCIATCELLVSFVFYCIYFWAVTWDFQQWGMCDQQRLIPACESCWQNIIWSFKLKMSLPKLVWDNACHNDTLLETTCQGSFVPLHIAVLRKFEMRSYPR